MMSAGIRSGVNWMREKLRLSASASVRTSIVLPRPGTPSSSTWPPASRQVSTPSTTSRLPTMTLPISSRKQAYLPLKFLDFDLRRHLLALVHFVGFLCDMRVDCRDRRQRPYSRGRMRSK